MHADSKLLGYHHLFEEGTDNSYSMLDILEGNDGRRVVCLGKIREEMDLARRQEIFLGFC
jgi:hypothetical protein